MRNNILYGVSIFTLVLLAISMFAALVVAVYPFNYVTVQKVTPLKSSYARGDAIEKVLMICKKTDVPIKVVLEMIDGDIVPLASKESFAPAGCNEYIIAEEIPKTTKLEEHSLMVTISYNVFFRTITTRFNSDTFIVTNNVLKE